MFHITGLDYDQWVPERRQEHDGVFFDSRFDVSTPICNDQIWVLNHLGPGTVDDISNKASFKRFAEAAVALVPEATRDMTTPRSVSEASSGAWGRRSELACSARGLQNVCIGKTFQLSRTRIEAFLAEDAEDKIGWSMSSRAGF